MFTFLLPNPISDENVECTQAILKVVYGGADSLADYFFDARLTPKTDAPVFINLGFNFYGGGRYDTLWTSVNYPGFNERSIMSYWGVSHWLADEFFRAAFDQGVNFRMTSTTDSSRSMRSLSLECRDKLDGPKNRYLGRFDGNDDREYTPNDILIATYGDIYGSSQQIDLSYPLGKLYEEFFS
jgi:hypothetical protein